MSYFLENKIKINRNYLNNLKSNLVLFYLSISPIYFIPYIGSIVKYKFFLFAVIVCISIITSNVNKIKNSLFIFIPNQDFFHV